MKEKVINRALRRLSLFDSDRDHIFFGRVSGPRAECFRVWRVLAREQSGKSAKRQAPNWAERAGAKHGAPSKWKKWCFAGKSPSQAPTIRNLAKVYGSVFMLSLSCTFATLRS